MAKIKIAICNSLVRFFRKAIHACNRWQEAQAETDQEELPIVAYQSPDGPPLPANVQPLRVVEPEEIRPWLDDFRNQLALTGWGEEEQDIK